MRKMDSYKILSEIPLFSGLSQHQLEEIGSITVEKRFRKGEMIFAEGEDGNGFYVVAEGRVKIFKVSMEGKEQILHFMEAGQPFGEVAVFAGQRFPANAAALSACRLLFLPRKAFADLIQHNASLSLNMLAELSKRLRQFTIQIESLSLKEVPGRLAAYLVYLHQEQGQGEMVKLSISKGQLASLLGTIPETLSRIFAKMGQQGLIRVNGRQITIIDRQGLQDLAR